MPYRGYTAAQKKATEKYHKEHLEQIAIRVPKGKRQEYKQFAESQGKTLVGLIVELLGKEIENNS